MSRLVLLAAGMGTRMAGSAGGLPKALLPLPTGRSLMIENLENALQSSAVDRATIVTGYRTDAIEREVARHASSNRVATAFNPFFQAAGPLGSIWAVRDVLLTDDCIVGNGDTLYGVDVFRALRDTAPLALVFSEREPVADEVKVDVSPDGDVLKVGKRLETTAQTGVSAGLLSIRGVSARERVFGCLSDMMRRGKGTEPGIIWHDLVNELIVTGETVRGVRVPPAEWHEVDTGMDFASLQEAVARGQGRGEGDL